MKYGLLIAGIITLFSCTKIEKIEMAGSIKPKLVVNCLLNPDEPIVVYITKSLSALDNAPMKPVANARVVLFKNNAILDTLLYDKNEGAYYTLKEPVQLGATYRVEAKASGMDPVTATTTAPRLVDISKVTVEANGREVDSSFYNGIWHYNGYFGDGKMRITFMDRPEEENYYMLQVEDIWTNHQGGGLRYGTTQWEADRLGLEMVTNYRSGGSYYFLNDQLENGREITLELKSSFPYNQFLYNSDSLISFKVTMYSMSPDFSKHLYSIKLWEQNEGNPFQEPVQVYSNIQGGYGVFGGKTVTEKSTPFPY